MWVKKNDDLCFLLTPIIVFLSGQTQKMNLFQSLTNAMDIILDSDPSAGAYFILNELDVYFKINFTFNYQCHSHKTSC